MLRIYVGNINYSTTPEQLREVFGEFGPVHAANVVTDQDTGRSKGYAFLEMDEGEGRSAMQALDQTELDGRTIRVSEAQSRPKYRREPRADRRDKRDSGW